MNICRPLVMLNGEIDIHSVHNHFSSRRARNFQGFQFLGVANPAIQDKFAGINFQGSKMGGVRCGITNSTVWGSTTLADCYYEFAISFL